LEVIEEVDMKNPNQKFEYPNQWAESRNLKKMQTDNFDGVKTNI
jgi:hypothetical protein